MSDENGQTPLPGQKSFLPLRVGWKDRLWHLESGFLQHMAPALNDLLCRAKTEDGNFRAGTTLMFFAEDGRLKCCLHDKASGHSAFLTLDPESDWVCQIEEAIQAGLDWRTKRRS